MSTFGGKFKEIPGISIDKFNGCNLDSEVFLLSHCHVDHMDGLESETFHQQLVRNNRFLYLSHISAEILRRLYPEIANNLKELDRYTPTILQVGEINVSITTIPAGHCPGSVMFLLEASNNSTVLYTGDFRINPRDLKKLKAFHNYLNQVKTINKVYLDTTFFLKAYLRFPSRAESLDEICLIAQDWISKSPKHIIKIETGARYGYEYLFMEIYKQLKFPVHVNEEAYDFYKLIPEMDQAVTKCAGATQIHSACGSVYLDICKNSVWFEVKTIKVSAWRWKNHNFDEGISNLKYRTHFVCYSTHASYEEGAALIQFLKPEAVEPSVLHRDDPSNLEIYKNIAENLGKSIEIAAERPKLFVVKTPVISESSDESSPEENNTTQFNTILDSPPRKRSK